MKRLVIGNQAIAYGALAAGVDLAAGYPGTPSSEALAEILQFAARNERALYVEWSVNEKVAFEIAAAAAWSGKRSLAAMKMSGANVAADSILSVAYSGTRGGLVLYVADDPGAEAGMPEQDTRLFAQWAGLPVLEPSGPGRAYELTRWAFELSESSELPVILRAVTSVAQAREELEAEYLYRPLNRSARFEKNVLRYTKAGAAICVAQHRALLRRLAVVERAVHEAGINRLQEVGAAQGAFVVACGSLIPCVREALSLGGRQDVSAVFLEAVYPLDGVLAGGMFEKAERILVLEELEPFMEMLLRSQASRLGWRGEILGKLDGLLPRTGKYDQDTIEGGLKALTDGYGRTAFFYAPAAGPGQPEPAAAAAPSRDSGAIETAAAAPASKVEHPITFCAGCPHRGTFMAINRALKQIGLNRDNTVVTGDIGCTILGMNEPFRTCWTEVSMGSSIGLAQGFQRAGLENPVIATIGDSTFFHAGIPPLINAVQHGSNLLVIILDNGWTGMTGFQVNPGTSERFQPKGGRRVDIEAIVRGIGVDSVRVVGPFDQQKSVEAIARALRQEGVKVIISRQECALTAARRQERTPAYRIDPDACTFCRSCLRETGCPALQPAVNGRKSKQERIMTIDAEACTGCGLCLTCCRFQAIRHQEQGRELSCCRASS